MATDAVTFIRALSLEQVDLLGFSMGGMIALLIAHEPTTVGPQGDPRGHRAGRW
jgi:esterase/lipase